jgi:hypothetical protein
VAKEAETDRPTLNSQSRGLRAQTVTRSRHNARPQVTTVCEGEPFDRPMMPHNDAAVAVDSVHTQWLDGKAAAPWSAPVPCKRHSQRSFCAAARLHRHTAGTVALARGAGRLDRSTIKPVPRTDSAIAVDLQPPGGCGAQGALITL